jgi:GNAT superfamily N-acetyltransferase
MRPPSIRRGTPDDARACQQLLWESATALGTRQGTPLSGTADEWWASSEPLHRFLGEHAAEWWVAEDPDAGELIGYARSIERGGLFELTEFFVRPGQQSRGVGRALLVRAFPSGRGEVRSIIATMDVRAQARYYAAGTVARFPIFTVAGEPMAAEPANLESIPIGSGAALVSAVTEIERAVLGYPRGDAEVRWLLERREGYVYRRDGGAVGFAFVGKLGSGPMAALDPANQPDILLHVEGRAKALAVEKLELEVPSVNEVALRHLLGRGFRLDPWINLLMSDKPFGEFDRFIGYDPPVFL